MLARAAFKKELQQSLDSSFYIPVLIDGDVEKSTMKKYRVRGYPTLKFADSKGEVHGQMGQKTVSGLIAASKSAIKNMGRPRLSKEYITVLKSRNKLERSLKKNNYRNALKAIKAIEEIGHKGVDLDKALREKMNIEKIALKRFEEAKQVMESKPKKAKSLLRKVSKDFGGLQIADEAKQLAGTIDV